MKKNSNFLEKRQKLAELTADFRKLRERKANEAKDVNESLYWLSRTINSFIVDYYKQQTGAKEFNTFNYWREQGKIILKGEKGFPVWGRPLNKKDEEKQEGEEPSNENINYYPMCYLFHENQTKEIKEG